MEGMMAISEVEANDIFASPDLIAVGARGDEARRARHGTKTTFVRVLEIHAGAIPASLPSLDGAGEIRLVGRPDSPDAAVAAVRAVGAIAGGIPVTGFSLADLVELGSDLRTVARRLREAGLEAVAEAPIDILSDAIAAVRECVDAGLPVPRLTVHKLAADARVKIVSLARDIQQATGAVRVFAPLARVSSIAQPSTGYDDVKQIAVARLLADNIDSIQVDWPLYGPKLAQVALTMGADDVDGVSPFAGNLGRRRSPIEEIRGNIVAAGLEPAERNARFEVLEPA
jgi:CofH/MqnC-like protein